MKLLSGFGIPIIFYVSTEG